MKFKSTLTEAILLKRHYRFLAEVVLKNKKKRMLYCPNLGPISHCDVLGSRIWFSSANRLSQGYLDIWEITEVNGGWLVLMNPGHAPFLVREAVELGVVAELEGFHFLQSPLVPGSATGIELLIKNDREQCFVHIEPVLFANDQSEGFFPDEKGWGSSALYDLMALKEMGHRAILFYCVQHSGVGSIRPADAIDPMYGKILREAVSRGVEVLAYRVNIDFQEIRLEARVPVLGPEDIISR